ncbi:MAG: NAD-glutamate dehydrogenase [Alphaproteobacteria bacterium]|nr:NAD-glutamate dehydrogenase [Alphaproteobacteria bacterium]
MGVKAEQLKAELLARVQEMVRDKMAGPRAPLIETFLRLLYANVPPADLVGLAPDTAYSSAIALWHFALVRQPGTAKVRAYNPTVAEHGWRSRHTIVEMVNDDMPFLVDSVTAELNRLNLTVHLVVHPIMKVAREADGKLAGIGESGGEQAKPESIMRIEVDERTAGEDLEAIRTNLERVLADVRAAVRDWRTMRQKLTETVATLEKGVPQAAKAEVDEARAFLRWLDDDHYTYLGYREYDVAGEGTDARLEIVPSSGLGILADPERRVFDDRRNFGRMGEDIVRYVLAPQLLTVTKANRRSTVHRPVHMDTIGIKRIDKTGKVVGEWRFVGLFTSVAYSLSPRAIPMLRRKVENVQHRAGFAAASHDGKALAHILETFPRDELMQIGEDELLDCTLGILHLQERQRIALFARKDALERYVSCLIYVPRDRLNTDLRVRLLAIVAEAYNGGISAFYSHMTDEPLARLHVIVRTRRGHVPAVDVGELEARLIEAGRTWPDRLRQSLIERFSDTRGLALFNLYASAFPAAYRERFDAAVAVEDIVLVEEARQAAPAPDGAPGGTAAGRGLALTLYRPVEADRADQLGFKIFHRGAPLALSDVLPMLEHMGVRAISEMPFGVALQDADGKPAETVWIHDFALTLAPRPGVVTGELDLGQVRDRFHDVFAKTWRGEMESDGFNRLVLLAGLDARGILVLRSYAKYLRQAAFTFSQHYIEETLSNHPRIARRLVDLFAARFNPALDAKADDRAVVERGIAVEIEHALDAVTNLDEDRILRRYLNLIGATLRTNHWQRDEAGRPKPYLSIKLDSRAVDELPLPRPLVEVFVYAPRVEAVHLRGGRVARGGIRWSDRREDFRTEILGLMKAQMVKNAVIVPVGSKGGFVVKRPPAGGAREAVLAEGIECYKTLMRGLLDVTDSYGVGGIRAPQDVVRRDGDDPYLVVAADKGTATFSDIANSVSLDYGFWLGDAFASGGSAGYDHKKMGITARGAWESVKRHFRELGRDTQAEDFTVAGVGDMSGDVFGNGMLLSRHIRLVAAFDHRHIFLDPAPDAARGFAERKRLFELPRSSWGDYDRKLISKGGGVFERSLKTVKLTPEVRAALGLERESMTPAELMRAILAAPVDLLWFGGIGTYVKAKAETNAEVGDRANDAIRIDAAQIRAKVVGEGANLGMTQRARIEYGLAGGRGNTDAVDNSAGVDTSDHEVNIKILLGDIVASGDMTLKQRDKLLEAMTDEVGRLVLRDNYEQSQILSIQELQGPGGIDQHALMMRDLEKAGRLDRAIEYLPDDETLVQRQNLGKGLTRPELAVLLAYAKMALYDQLLASDLPDDPALSPDLVSYFPEPLREKSAAEIRRHRLRREIVATVVTNGMVNRVGSAFVAQIASDTGRSAADITRAYVIAREVLELGTLWSAVEALDGKVKAPAQYAMLAEIGRAAERATRWVLASLQPPLVLGDAIARFTPGIQAIAAGLDQVLSPDAAAELKRRAAAIAAEGAPADVAQKVAQLDALAAGFDIVRIAEPGKLKVKLVGRLYFAVGHRFGLDWLRGSAASAVGGGRWSKLAFRALNDEIDAIQGQLAGAVIQACGPDGRLDSEAGPAAAIEAWSEQRRAPVKRAGDVIADIRATGRVDLAMLAVAARQLRALAG